MPEDSEVEKAAQILIHSKERIEENIVELTYRKHSDPFQFPSYEYIIIEREREGEEGRYSLIGPFCCEEQYQLFNLYYEKSKIKIQIPNLDLEEPIYTCNPNIMDNEELINNWLR